jgi:predicted dehydrogenase
MDSSDVSRRTFIKNTAAATAVAMATPVVVPKTAAAAATKSPNGKLRIGYIGVGGRAQTHLGSGIKLQNDGEVEIVAVCDVFNRHRDEAAAKVKAGTGHEPKKIADYRELLADKSLDAVCIATPDHWHAKQTMDAFKADKHVYCEKPMTHSVEEAVAVYHAWK